MKRYIIAAINKNRVIGKEGKLPWHISEDLKRFKHLTIGHTVLMGRKTFESLGKLLPERRNVVISSSKIQNVETYSSLEEAFEKLDNEEKVFIIGGGEIYQQTINNVDGLFLTIVDNEIDGDVYFPSYEHLINTIYHLEIEEIHDGFTFKNYLKNN
ncbi:MAG: dihydrofolate reductase [Bacteroidetes bacterium]|nr:dihydrofolate reductase [Bacteroidota bacterium]